MSDRPIDLNLSKSTDTRVSEENAPTPDEFKRRLASVLDRGWAVDRLTVNVPPDKWGEWIPKDESSLARADMLGFTPAPEFIANQRLNDDGTAKQGVGDVIFMTQPMWMHKMIEEKRADDYRKNHLNTKYQKEEREFLNNNAKIDMPASANSDALEASGRDIKEALKPPTK